MATRRHRRSKGPMPRTPLRTTRARIGTRRRAYGGSARMDSTACGNFRGCSCTPAQAFLRRWIAESRAGRGTAAPVDLAEKAARAARKAARGARAVALVATVAAVRRARRGRRTAHRSRHRAMRVSPPTPQRRSLRCAASRWVRQVASPGRCWHSLDSASCPCAVRPDRVSSGGRLPGL